MLLRIKQLVVWTKDFKKPFSIWMPGLFNPMSYMTAIMQTTARAKGLPLDKMANNTVISEIADHEEITGEPDEGTFIHGLYFEGCSWERGEKRGEGYLIDAAPKILHPACPVINVVSVPLDDKNVYGYYQCPIYVTSMRGATYICLATAKLENDDGDPKYWVLQGACLLLTDD